LRQGLSETLVLLSVFGDHVKAVSNAGARANVVVRSLLNGANAERWWSLSGLLRIMAEACPEALLDALEESLVHPESPVVTLFKEEVTPLGGAHHSNLLWGLEQLAWSPRFLGRAASVLATLARLDPGGKYANRPDSSLLSIFRLWRPQTSARLDERLRVLDTIRKSEPEVAFSLMLSLLPNRYDVAMEGPQTRWRDFATGEPEVITYDLLGKGAVKIAARLLADAQTNGTRWRKIFDCYAQLPQESRERANAQLLEVWPSIPDPGRPALWATLRTLLHHHRAFSHAAWALSEDQLVGVERVYRAMEPAGVVEHSAWLFDTNAQLPNPADEDWQADERTAADLRRDLVQKLLLEDDVETIFGLASEAKIPEFVGAAAAEANGRPESKDQILIAALLSAEQSKLNFAYGMIRVFWGQAGAKWAEEFLKRLELLDWPTDKIVSALLLMPPSQLIWDSVSRLGKDVEDRYWSQIVTLRIGDELSAVEFAMNKLLAAKRALAAIPFAGRHAKALPAELLVTVLMHAAGQSWAEISSANDTTMFIHWVETLLDRLDHAEGISEAEITVLEWLYLPMLEHGRRPPVKLHAKMATNPEFFVDVLKKVYGPESPESDRELTRGIARQAHTLLRSWHAVPGMKNSVVDRETLDSWVTRVRQLCAAAEIGQIGDQQIGQVLASAPEDPDGVWPAKSVREVIESVRSRDLELGIAVGVENNQGVTKRGVLDGGIQERSLARKYRDWARATELEWHRTSALLERIARTFEEHGQWHDEHAKRSDWSM
jgi:hypothetical protein